MSVQPHQPTWADGPADVHSRRILIVDDDPSIVNLLKEDLELEGHQVLGALDGQMALRLALQGHFDLIVLDINMPMTSGFKVFEFLRGNPTTARIPIIFVTGEISQDVFPLIDHAPRAAHVKKPLDLDSFNSLVKHFLERYPND